MVFPPPVSGPIVPAAINGIYGDANYYLFYAPVFPEYNPG